MRLLSGLSPRDRAHFIRDRLPAGGLFAGHQWRISPAAFGLGKTLAEELERLGRVFLQFYRAVNLLYRQSATGQQPSWVANLLDQGKPVELIELQRAESLKAEIPRVIRPDILLTEEGLAVTELDSLPGGIGLTAWLNETYGQWEPGVIGGPEGMFNGWAGIFGRAHDLHVVVSQEAASYRPEMVWLCDRLNERAPDESSRARHHPGGGGENYENGSRTRTKDEEEDDSGVSQQYHVQDEHFLDFQPGDAVYRFFELFDLANVPNSWPLFAAAQAKRIGLTPPPKPVFEEKLLLALLWNRNLSSFWRQALGQGYFERLRRLVPYSWVVDPGPLPPHAAIPELDLTSWEQLKGLSQRQRALVLKVSGFSAESHSSRGVWLGSDLSAAAWAAAVDKAIGSFAHSPCILQRYHKPRLVQASWFDFGTDRLVLMSGRVRLCPYYFVVGEGDSARATLGGCLATICPADKKLIHGMSVAILTPCSAED
jgi:hypothetical protein